MKLTIFTPTYNRASTLPRLFAALQRQTDKRFEWLIVDDGSTDNTEQLIQEFRGQTDSFDIRYYQQDHGGKPRAQNKAVDLATGELFLVCDSNKYPADNAVELILKMESTVQHNPTICGVGGYRADFNGRPFGGEMTLGGLPFVDCTRLEGAEYNIVVDKSTAFYTNILRKYKSPEYPGETFVSEGVWLIPMAADGYKTRWFPEILIYGEYTADGLTKQGANSRIGHSQNFQGYLHLIRVEIAARGIQPVLFMIHEALDIAKEKGMPTKTFASRIGCSRLQVIRIQIVRLLHKIYGVFSKALKKIIGAHLTERLRKVFKRK